jgi:signal transduction histidine kinase
MLPNVLIVTGNYDIIAAVRRTLRSDRMVTKAAYTHRDMLYMLAQQSYDGLIVDASVMDRYTDEYTVLALNQNQITIPALAVALNSEAQERAKSLSIPFITVLDKQAIEEAVFRLLGKSIPRRETGVIRHEEVGAGAAATIVRRSQEYETMAALSKSLTEVLDLSEVLNRVVESARMLTDAEEGMILLPDENDARKLVLRARVGIDLEAAQNFRVKVEDTLPGEVFRQGKPSMGAEGDNIRLKTDFLVRSVLYVPIILQGKSIGVLGVNNRTKPDVFNFHQQELLENLASYASIAIQNASIHEESVRRAKELEMLVKASQTISATLVMDETLANICEQLALVLKISRAEIYRWTPPEPTLDLRAHYYQSLWRGLKGPVIDLTQMPVVKTALDNDHHEWEKGEVFTTMIVPVTADGRLLGALRCFYVNDPNHEKCEAALKDVRRVALEVLAAVLNQSQDSTEDDVYLLLNYINQLIRSDWSELSLLSAKGTSLIVLAMAGKAIWREPPYQQIQLDSRPELEKALREQKILDPEAGRGTFALPLAHRNRNWGIVLLSDTDRNRVYARAEIDMASALVSQATIAIENAQLVHDLEQSLIELRETQEKLVQTARLTAMGELAAVVAHQINNPLTTITVDTEMMLEYEPKDSPNYDSMVAIYRAGKRAAATARRLLAISRPNDGKTPPEPVDVGETVEGILQLVGSHIERKNIKIHPKLPDTKIPGVLAVKGQLDDIWLNLIMNAHDALGDKPNSQIGVEVAYRALDEHIVVRVWDNGPGIPDELKERIFSPFFTTKRPGEGTGLGLHICRQVVQQIGGTITVESAMGKGTRFTVELPTVNHEITLRRLEELGHDAYSRS